MGRSLNYFSVGDVIDLYHLIRIKGLKVLFSLSITQKKGLVSKWDLFDRSVTDFWIIPVVQKHWNYLCTGNADLEYETYVSEKYLNGRSRLEMLSVGCGNSDHERAFSKSGCFSSITGIDVSEKQLALAKQEAESHGCSNIVYEIGDFETEVFEPLAFDVVLFHSSLHHFKNTNKIILKKVMPILKHGGLLIIHEYTGPNRLQWTDEQLAEINTLLKKIPSNKKTWYSSRKTKKKVYSPGILRMRLADPTEAPDSESILDVLNQNFETLEEKKLGGNIIHPLLKGIAHHFCDNSPQTLSLLNSLLTADEAFVSGRKSDFTFGVYKKR